MDKYHEVIGDLIVAFDKIQYEDSDKKLIQTDLLLKLYGLYREENLEEKGIVNINKLQYINKQGK